MNVVERLDAIERCLDAGLDAFGLSEALNLLGASGFPKELIPEIHVYGEYLPRAGELGFNPEQRFLHFLWECLDGLPIGLMANFSIPFRRMIAQRLFKRCGDNFIAERNVRFNFGHNIEVGEDVFMNRNVFLDSKGGIEIGDSSGLGENVVILTHSHSESVHYARSYAKVTIGDFVKVNSNAVIMPGVNIGDQAIVAAMSVVTRDVPPNTVVAGIPARPLRERRNEGREGEELNHIWLRDGAFQLPL
jgi:acetyltransferase-like isoleucine patch superfamily enzyme